MICPGRNLTNEFATRNNVANSFVTSSGFISQEDHCRELISNPCDGLSGSALTTCQGQSYRAVAQVYIRDTDSDRLLTVGKAYSGLTDVEIAQLTDDLQKYLVLSDLQARNETLF